ncbi:MAG: hypothetical protein NTZ90_16170 [Proteobacteria bacterium]|nr:hypothetical protein [Pseudomonadota bacterium]
MYRWKKRTHIVASERGFGGLSLALLVFITTASVGCRTSDSGSFVMDTGTPLTTETSVTSTRPLDNGQSFRMGYGYDDIAGTRHTTCLDPTTFSLVGRNVRATDMHFRMINNKEDLANELNIQVNAEASASYGTVTGSTTAKVNILKKSSFSDHSVMGLVTFLHRAQMLEVESDGDILTATMADLLAKDPKAFRLRCGDEYTRSATTGAALYISVNADAKSSSITDHVGTENELKAAFSNLITASTTATVSKDTQKTLSKYSITMSCSSVGTNSSACAQPIVAVNADDLGSIIDFLNKAKASVSASIDGSPNLLVAVDEQFKEYPKPSTAVAKKKFDVFFDFNPQLNIVHDLLQKEVEVNNACGIFQYPSCAKVRTALAGQIKKCAVQEDWPDCDPSQVSLDALNKELGSADRGIVVLNSSTKHTSVTLDFNSYGLDNVRYEPNKIYNLTDQNFNDEATDYRATIVPGWQLRLFQHVNGGGACVVIKSTDRVDRLRYFSGYTSSFRLEPAQDRPAPCEQ